jgi:Na+/H+ antiporter NhaD/arsenite permease-like protein
MRSPDLLAGSVPAILWSIPFAGMLLSVALGPSLAPGLWHRHTGKIALAWSLALGLPLALTLGAQPALALVARALLSDYLPFVILLACLFCVAGGIHLHLERRASPALNTLLLGAGALLAGLIGTAAATLVLARPLLQANRHRPHSAHVLVFLIYLAGNIGGALSPLGDPPLFVGFLHGVPFLWPLRALAQPMLLLGGWLLVIFILLDTWLWMRERPGPGAARPAAPAARPARRGTVRPGLNGLANLPLLALAVLTVFACGLWQAGPAFLLLGAPISLSALFQSVALIAIAVASLRLTAPEIRAANGFSWAPIVEVCKIFAGFFITLIPVISLLQAGASGSGAAPFAASGLAAAWGPGPLFFWATGILSAFLDNVPTYLIFFNMAGGDGARLALEHPHTLMAISCGAVFMGALTYVGNAPNLMVRAIAEERGAPLPGFFSYIAWAVLALGPGLVAIDWLYLR